MSLSPTLWRTARALSGETRLGLLRRLVGEPGQTVSQLAEAMGLSLPRASQELRRLQSRGLLQASRTGLMVRYRPIPDPLVDSAKPILAAMEESFARFPEAEIGKIVCVAQGFSHVRRLAIVQELLRGPRSAAELQRLLQLSGMAAYRHLNLLRESGVVRREGKDWALEQSDHPLAKCLARLLR